MRHARVAAIMMAIALLTASVMGCLGKDPLWESPISRLPRVILDEVGISAEVPENQTRIYVTAVEDHRYERINITLMALNGTIIEYQERIQIYSIFHSTNLTDFLLHITVIDIDGDSEDRYEFLAHLEVFKDPDIVFTITEKDPKKGTDIGDPKEVTDPPWRTLLERSD